MQTKDIAAKLTELKPGPYQNRQDFDPTRLLSLAQSIGEQGFINPPLVSGNGSGYHLIAGERRWRAKCAHSLVDLQVFPTLEAAIERVAATDGPAYIAAQSVLDQVDVTIRLAVDATPEQLHIAAVTDNSERQDLNPIEEALEFQDLMQQYGWSASKTARKVKKSDPYVRGRLVWLELEPEIQQLVATRELQKDTRVSAALLSVPDSATRIGLAKRFAARATRIKAIERACAKAVKQLAQAQKPPQKRQSKTNHIGSGKTSVSNAVVISRKPPKMVDIPPSRLCLCVDCREVIDNLAEEFCNDCLTNGLSEKCVGCPGVVEFINNLMRPAQCR